MDLVKILRANKIGCHILAWFIACILFAYDMSLLAPTSSSMQRLLDICSEYGDKFCLKFDVKKTKVMVCGKMHTNVNLLASLNIRGVCLDYVNSYRYLGFHLIAGLTLKVSSMGALRDFLER